MTRRDWIAGTDHWVVKIGSAVFLRDTHRLDRPAFGAIVEDVARLIAGGTRITLVSSGAVALGREHLGWPDESAVDIPNLQAYAAVGQSRLMQMYAQEFAHHGHKVAQVLFSRDDLDDRPRFLNARTAVDQIHRMGVVPVVNENDTVATEELRFGDNDRLAAMTCGLVDADLFVVLSDVQAVLDVEIDEAGQRRLTDPIHTIAADDPHLDEVAGPSDTSVGTGGMVSKVDAAKIAARMNVPTLIGSGKATGILTDIARAQPVGTLITPAGDDALSGKKVWLSFGARAVGRLTCDAGAVEALTRHGASLLPSGVTGVDGQFSAGSVVELVDLDGQVIGRGVSVYSSAAIGRLAGHQSADIDEILGFRVLDSVVHRDSLVML